MNPKLKMEKDAAFIIGIVFSILGGVFMALGTLFGMFLGEESRFACILFVSV